MTHKASEDCDVMLQALLMLACTHLSLVFILKTTCSGYKTDTGIAGQLFDQAKLANHLMLNVLLLTAKNKEEHIRRSLKTIQLLFYMTRTHVLICMCAMQCLPRIQSCHEQRSCIGHTTANRADMASMLNIVSHQ